MQNALPMLKQHADWVHARRARRRRGRADRSHAGYRSARARAAAVALGHRRSASATTAARAALHAVRPAHAGVRHLGQRQVDAGDRPARAASARRATSICLIDPEGDYETSDDAIVVGDERARPRRRGDRRSADARRQERGREPARRPARAASARSSSRCSRACSSAACAAGGRTGSWSTKRTTCCRKARSTLQRCARSAADRPAVHHRASRSHRDAHSARDRLAARASAMRRRGAVRAFARAAGVPGAARRQRAAAAGRRAVLVADEPRESMRLRTTLPRAERHRHRRKYAAGSLGDDKSFYFRGPREALNLRAHNLALFLQIADGVDDETWLHHLRQHDYSSWLRERDQGPRARRRRWPRSRASSKPTPATPASRSARRSNRPTRCPPEPAPRPHAAGHDGSAAQMR